MPNPNAIVSNVIQFHPPLDRPPAEILRAEPEVSIELQGGRRVRIDPADRRSLGFIQILDGLRKLRLPVYIEIDPERSTLARLLIPLVARIVGVHRLNAGTLVVDLEPSQARHLLRFEAQDFRELLQQLEEALRTRALVVVTETDAHEIIDVRAYTPGPEGPPFPFPKPPPRILRLWGWLKRIVLFWRWLWWPWWWFRCISIAKAQQVFTAMSATSCDPVTVPSPCIPFLYPDDGCWGRAHEMCRLIINMGLSPMKVWIQGSLYVNTKNNPNCHVSWGWHVAPTLCVRGASWFQTQTMVIDPSLFTGPVPKAMWKGVQGDPNATLTDSAAAIFYLWSGATDPTYAQTNQVLAVYRLQLQNRAFQYGPPPYANCP